MFLDLLAAFVVASALYLGDLYIQRLVRRCSRIWHQEKYGVMDESLKGFGER